MAANIFEVDIPGAEREPPPPAAPPPPDVSAAPAAQPPSIFDIDIPGAERPVAPQPDLSAAIAAAGSGIGRSRGAFMVPPNPYSVGPTTFTPGQGFDPYAYAYGQGLWDPVYGTLQLGAHTFGVPQAVQPLAPGPTPNVPGAGIARGAGELTTYGAASEIPGVGALLSGPGAEAGLLRRGLTYGKQGLTVGATQPVTGPGGAYWIPKAAETAVSTALGPAFGLLGEGVIRLGQAGWNWLQKKVPGIVGERPPPDLTQAQADRINDFKDANVTPVPSQIKPDYEWQAGETRQAGAPGPMRDALEQGNTEMNNAVSNWAGNVGPQATAGTRYGVGNAIADALNTKFTAMQKDVGGLYDQVRNTVGPNFAAGPYNMINVIRNAADEAPALGPAYTTAINKLRGTGLVDPNLMPNIQQGATTGLSINQAEALRKSFGDLAAGTNDRAQKWFYLKMQRALDDDVVSGLGYDPFAQARQAAAYRFGQMDDVSKIISGKIKPEDIVNRFVTRGGIDDLQGLKDVLLDPTHPPQTLAAGQAAWDSLRRAAAQRLYAAGTEGMDQTVQGVPLFNNRKFNAAYTALGPEKTDILFDPGERFTLDRLSRVANYRTPLATPWGGAPATAASGLLGDFTHEAIAGTAAAIHPGLGYAARIGMGLLGGGGAQPASPEVLRALQFSQDVAARARGWGVPVPAFESLLGSTLQGLESRYLPSR